MYLLGAATSYIILPPRKYQLVAALLVDNSLEFTRQSPIEWNMGYRKTIFHSNTLTCQLLTVKAKRRNYLSVSL